MLALCASVLIHDLLKQLVGPFDINSEFVAEDFEMLEIFEIKQRIGRVADAIHEMLGPDEALEE